jgi:hypothetical protein
MGGHPGEQMGAPFMPHNMGGQRPMAPYGGGKFGEGAIKDVKAMKGGKGGKLDKFDLEQFLEGSYVPLFIVIILAFVLKIR